MHLRTLLWVLCLSYSRTRMKGDNIVQSALDSKFQRENNWSNKKSTVAHSDSIHQSAVNSCQDSSSWPAVKKMAKKTLKDERDEYWKNKVEPLVFQGDFPKLLIAEDNDLPWKSIIFNMPLNVLKFCTYACINSLPTNDNLLHWGKRTNNKCTRFWIIELMDLTCLCILLTNDMNW